MQISACEGEPGGRGERKMRRPKHLKNPNENEGIWLSGSLKRGAFICFVLVFVVFVVGRDFGLRERKCNNAKMSLVLANMCIFESKNKNI